MDNAARDIGDSEEIVGITKFLAYLEIVSARGESPQKCQEGSTCQKLIKNLSYKILSKKIPIGITNFNFHYFFASKSCDDQFPVNILVGKSLLREIF